MVNVDDEIHRCMVQMSLSMEKDEWSFEYCLTHEEALDLRQRLTNAQSRIAFYLADDGQTWGVKGRRWQDHWHPLTKTFYQ
jgi:hypothetical protein